MAKYFPECGWEPVILISRLPGLPPKGNRVIETDYEDVVTSLKSECGFIPEEGLQKQLGISQSKNCSYPTVKSKIIKYFKEVTKSPLSFPYTLPRLDKAPTLFG